LTWFFNYKKEAEMAADIVITEFMDPNALAHFKDRYAVLNDPSLVDDDDRLYQQVRSARGLIVRNRTQVNAALLEQAPHLEVIGRLGVGLDNIDLDACQARNITVCPAAGANDQAVAEYVIAGVLMLMRGAYAASDRVFSGEWPRQDLTGNEIKNQVMGLIGFGSIARTTAMLALGLGMRVMAYDPFVDQSDPDWGVLAERKESLKDLLVTSDAVSLHVPLNEATRHLIDADAIRVMKPSSVLINAARGGIVDESALADALHETRLRAAMLDVFENEPLPANSVLSNTPNLIATPHIAGITTESNQRVSDLTARNVLAVLEAS
jgi:(S)-sulfolactate dehydrogenase